MSDSELKCEFCPLPVGPSDPVVPTLRALCCLIGCQQSWVCRDSAGTIQLWIKCGTWWSGVACFLFLLCAPGPSISWAQPPSGLASHLVLSSTRSQNKTTGKPNQAPRTSVFDYAEQFQLLCLCSSLIFHITEISVNLFFPWGTPLWLQTKVSPHLPRGRDSVIGWSCPIE